MAQQINMTAVEWLKNNLPSLFIDDSGHYQKLFEQAKQMEKERIMQAYNDGKLAIINIDNNKSLEGYYNKTYGSIENELEQINQDNPITKGSTALVKVTSSQTEISDDEIKYAAYRDTSVNIRMEPECAFIDGAKWYKEQLKKK